MKKILVTALAFAALVVFADEEETPADEAPAAAPVKVEKPKTPSVSLTVKAYPLITKQQGAQNNNNMNMNRGMFMSQTKTQIMQMKWSCSVRVRERVPEDLKLEVYYIGQSADNKWIQIGETKEEALTLNDKGVWSGELLSPETTWTERKKNKNMRMNNFNNNSMSDNLPEKEGERIKGCIVRVAGEGKIWKTFSSDPRWAKVIKKDTFTIDELNPNKSRIGSR